MFGAAASAVVSIVLQGEDKASAAFDAVSGKAGALVGAIGGVGAVALGAGVGLAAVGAATVGMSQDFDASMNMFQARTGTATEEMGNFRDVALDIFNNNWGDSLGDVADAMGVVQNITGAGADEIEGLTTQALIMRDVFDKDISESTLAAKTLMDEFGLSGDQAMDFIATGFQRGLNSSDDFLDSIGEYSGLYSDLGFDVEAMFAIMETGMAGGVLGTDKISDAMKEFGIILNEGGVETATAFSDALGDNIYAFDEAQAAVERGEATWADYFPLIIDGLNDIQDPLERSRLQTALFGTMAEDLGVNFTDGLSTATVALGDMEGAAMAAGNTVSQGLGPAWEGITRNISTSFLPLGDALGVVLTDLAQVVIPLVEGAMAQLQPFMDALPVAIDSAFVAVTALGPQLTEIGTQVTALIEPITSAIGNFVSWQDVMVGLALAAGAVVIPAIIGVVAAAAPIVLTAAAIIGVVALLRNAWENDWGGIQGKTEAVGAFITTKFAELSSWFTDTLVPTVQEFATTWQERWETAQTVLTNVSEIFIEIFTEIGRWINENIVPWIEFLAEQWREDWDDMQKGLEVVWAFVEPVWIALGEWMDKKIPEALNFLRGAWQGVMGDLEQPVANVQDKWTAFTGAVQGFWEWISGKVFDFKISIPDLPDWATPGSPIPLHTAWQDFGNYLNQEKFSPQFDVSQVVPAPTGQSLAAGFAAQTAPAGGNVTYINIDVNDASAGQMLLRLIDELRSNSQVVFNG